MVYEQILRAAQQRELAALMEACASPEHHEAVAAFPARARPPAAGA